MKLIIYILLLTLVVIRYSISSNKCTNRLKILFLSAGIQSLLIFPILFLPIVEIKERGLDEFKTPFGTEIGLMFPTVISMMIMIICKNRYRIRFHDIRYPFFALLFTLLFSYISPYNYYYKATNLVFVLFFQLFFTVLILKLCMDYSQILESLYDGLKVIVIIEFVVSLSYVIGIDSIQSLFISNIDEVEWIREGTVFRRAYGTTTHPNRLGSLCAFIYVLFLSSYYCNYKKRQSLYLLVLSIIVVVLSQSRSALMASVITTFILYVTNLYKTGRLSTRRLLFIFVGGLILLFSFLSLNIIKDMIFNSDIEDQGSNRLAHYLAGWLILNDTSFIGVGLNSHVHYMYYQMNIEGVVGDWMTNHAIHSVHLVILVETGIIGFYLWVYYLFSRFKRFVSTSYLEMNNSVLWMTHFGMLLIVFVHGFTDPVYFQYQFLLLLFLSGAFIYKKSNNRPLITR